MEGKKRPTPQPPEAPVGAENEPARKKGGRNRKRRSSPEDIRARKRELRRSRRKRRSGTLLTIKGAADQSSEPKVLRFGSGQLKKMKLPPIFSLLDNPEPTVCFLDDLRVYAAANSIRYLSFDAHGCTNFGLDALVAMSAFVLGVKRKRKEKTPLNVGGTWPSDLSMQIVFKASGIPHHLGVPAAQLTPDQEKLVHRCELHSGRAVPSRFAMARQRNEATENVRKYFDGCLNTVGFALSRTAKTRLDNLISEVIGNAEEHGGPWSTIGHWQSSETTDGQLQPEDCAVSTTLGFQRSTTNVADC
jgi:hypothetical protein